MGGERRDKGSALFHIMLSVKYLDASTGKHNIDKHVFTSTIGCCQIYGNTRALTCDIELNKKTIQNISFHQAMVIIFIICHAM